jgi:hypothetical protein
MDLEKSIIIDFFQSRNLLIIVAAAGKQYAHLFLIKQALVTQRKQAINQSMAFLQASSLPLA